MIKGQVTNIVLPDQTITLKFLESHQHDEILLASSLITKVINSMDCYSDKGKEVESSVYTYDSILKMFDDPNQVQLFAYAKIQSIPNLKIPVGYLHGYFDCGTFWLNWLAIEDAFIEKRMGIMMFNELEHYLVNTHPVPSKMWFNTRTENYRAIRFFLGRRCNIICRLEEHWYDQDFYLWEKKLRS